MAEELARKANEAFVEENYAAALDLYSQAIALEPFNAAFYCFRATAQLKLDNFTDAVADASKAIDLDSSLAKAYLRKGMACYSLEEYHTALEAFKAGAALEPNNSQFMSWVTKCEEKLSEEGSKECQVVSTVPRNTLESTLAVVQTVKPKYRHEYYQTQKEVVVTVFAKSVGNDNVAIEFGEQFLSAQINVPGEDAYCLQKRLFAKVIPTECKYSILATKVEIRMVKADLIHWTSLEYVKDQTLLQKPNASSEMSRPKYPSSNRKSSTDWDKLEAQVKKEEKDEKLDGDAALNKFFRGLYQEADDDARRAMLKSFTESSGTVLSTNWNEVGSKTVEGTPPEGMEVKKWEI